MIERVDLEDNQTALKLLALQLTCSKIEARLAGIKMFPMLRESMQSLRMSGETFYGFWQGEELAGAISYTRKDDRVTICRLMVEPFCFRQGIAGRLLRFVEGLERDWTLMKVSTGTENVPAINLYRKHGFSEEGQSEVAPGISLTDFIKRASG